MAIFQGLLTAVSRSAGKILNTAFAWATVLLFGKVPQEKQKYLSVMVFGSVVWLVVLIGIAFPSVATFLLAFVTIPRWVDKNWIRIVMIVAAIFIPIIVGSISLLLLDPEDRPRGMTGKAKTVVRGYPFTVGLAVTLLMLTIFAPIMKLQTLARLWTSQHVPVIVEPEDYLHTVGEIQQALEKADFKTNRCKTNWMLRFPTKVVTLFSGGSMKNLVADELTTLQSDKLEVTLHPSDLIISGKEIDVVHARATLAQQLAFSEAHLTWTKEANEIEERLGDVWRELRANPETARNGKASGELKEIDHDLRTVKIPNEEWEVLFREKLLVERGLLKVMAGITDRPRELTEATPEEIAAPKVRPGLTHMRIPVIPAAAGATILILVLRCVSSRLGIRL